MPSCVVQQVVGALPIGASVEERLGELGPGLRRDRHALLAARGRWVRTTSEPNVNPGPPGRLRTDKVRLQLTAL